VSRITGALSEPGWRLSYATLGAQNLARWNALAAGDRSSAIDLIAELAHQQTPTASSRAPIKQKDGGIAL
jgi:hypothetical protein